MGDNTATDSDSADGVPLLEIADGSQGQNSESLDEDKITVSISEDDEPLPFWRKMAFAVGAMPYAMCTTIMGFYLSIFLLEVAILSPVYVLLIVFGGRVWDAITDPLVGYLTTRTKTRFGRLRPWMMIAALPAGAAYLFLWFVPPGLDNEDGRAIKFAYYISLYFAFQTLLTCIHVPYTSLTMHLSNNSKERDSATLYRMCFEVLASILGVGIYTIFFVAFVHVQDKGEGCDNGQREPDIGHRRAYRYHALLLGILIVICVFTTFIGVREQKEEVCTNKRIGFIKGMKETLGYRPYTYLLALEMFSWLGLQFIQGNFALYVKYTLGLEDQYPYIIVLLLVATIAWMPICQLILSKYGKKRAFSIGMWTLMPIVLCLLYVDFVPYLVYPLTLCGALGLATILLVPWSMIPDVIDEAALAKNIRREELFYAYFVFGSKFAGGVTLGVSTAVYKIAGYDENKCDQPWTVPLALKLLVTVPSFFFIAISLLFIHLYPITEERRKITKHLLQERRRSSRVATMVSLNPEQIEQESVDL